MVIIRQNTEEEKNVIFNLFDAISAAQPVSDKPTAEISTAN